jgi:hypothetical protein
MMLAVSDGRPKGWEYQEGKMGSSRIIVMASKESIRNPVFGRLTTRTDK